MSEITVQQRRHSAAHLMARAVMNLFEDVQVDIGPATDEGFYYDFDLPHRLSPEDFPKIEAEIARLIALDEPFVRKEVTAEEAAKLLAGQKYKLERLADVVADGVAISTYAVGDYVEMCRGPHVEHSKQIGVVKLTRVAGSYYRGDEKNKMLQRIYGIVAKDQAEMDEIVARAEEAKRRDHRKLGVELDLFHLDPEDPGQVFWHPRGWSVYVTLQDYMRRKLVKDGYREVNTPALMPRSLWERSGHWAHYQQNMFITESEKRLFAVKPMNCPPSGTLHGIMRVRGFVQDDAHILCTEEQIEQEVAKFCRLLKDVYSDFGFDKNLLVKLSTMPEDHVGDVATWQHAEAALAAACKAAGMDYEIQPGEGAFYGPKLEFTLVDALARQWQCGTIQLDYQLPSPERLTTRARSRSGSRRSRYACCRSPTRRSTTRAGCSPRWRPRDTASRSTTPPRSSARRFARPPSGRSRTRSL